MGKYDLIIKLVKERFERYQTYHQILGVDPSIDNDDLIKDTYEKRCTELELMIEKFDEEVADEIRNIVKPALEDAFNALKDKNSRKHYRELLDSMEGPEI